ATVKVMPEPRYSFPYFTWADRKAAFKPEKTMDDVEYIRPMLVTFLMIPLLIGESPTATEIFDAAEKGGRIMKKLDDYEITRYWQQILTQAWRFQEAKGGYSANDPVKMRYKLGLIRIGRELIEKAVE
ncbi:MAG TPA: hypothetical protein VJ227_01175, partial [Patescibacteria group bacterium]|nr:hypothetical protein [Patescibacteria group bacterium]